METKYFVGEKVRVIKRLHGHGFTIGDIVTITDISPEGSCDARKGKITWGLSFSEIEKVVPNEPLMFAPTPRDVDLSPEETESILKTFVQEMEEDEIDNEPLMDPNEYTTKSSTRISFL